MDKSMIKMR